jgi:hypothetical protein
MATLFKKTWGLLVIYLFLSASRAEWVARDSHAMSWTVVCDAIEAGLIGVIGFAAFAIRKGSFVASVGWALFGWVGVSLALGIFYALLNTFEGLVPIYIGLVALIGLSVALASFLPWALLGALAGVGLAWGVGKLKRFSRNDQ